MDFEEEEDDELLLAPCSEWPLGILCFCQLNKMSYKVDSTVVCLFLFFVFLRIEEKRSAVDEILRGVWYV